MKLQIAVYFLLVALNVAMAFQLFRANKKIKQLLKSNSLLSSRMSRVVDLFLATKSYAFAPAYLYVMGGEGGTPSKIIEEVTKTFASIKDNAEAIKEGEKREQK